MLITFIQKLLGKNKQLPQSNEPQEVKYLIAGLGNIGPDYENTRHNIGFMILDEIATAKEVPFAPSRYGDIAQFRFKGRTFILLKPSTYMNRSGKAIHYWLTREKVDLERLLVITDDVALPTGTIRLKAKGSDGGHNGLSNIISVLGTSEFARLRFGIGSNFPKGMQVQYVLGKWEDEELEVIQPVIKTCTDLVVSFATIGIERTMNYFNTKPSKKKKETRESYPEKPTPDPSDTNE
jgi:PTH1 family peptidyl-tRNA hydrolase